jgi:hypothetical protein
MGRWGTDVFESDTASDWAVDTCHRLLREAEKLLRRRDFGVEEVDLLLPPLDVVCYLCEQADAVPFRDPDILSWRQRVLSAFERDTAEADWPQKNREAYRKMIAGVFDRLEKAVLDSGAPDRWNPEPGSIWARIKQLGRNTKRDDD